MKRFITTAGLLACLVVPRFVAAAQPKADAGSDRFYGKITAVDQGSKSLTVHNKKQNADERFQWNDGTTVISDRKTVTPTELKVGQSLIVSYVTENDINKATRLTIRQPFKKLADKSTNE